MNNGLVKEFRDFILRGNVVDLAIAVVIGVAFGAVVTALVEDFITPLIAALGGQPDFSALDFTINGSTFRYGHFLNSVIAFVILAAVIFVFVVKPMNMLLARRKKEEATTPAAPAPAPLTAAEERFIAELTSALKDIRSR